MIILIAAVVAISGIAQPGESNPRVGEPQRILDEWEKTEREYAHRGGCSVYSISTDLLYRESIEDNLAFVAASLGRLDEAGFFEAMDRNIQHYENNPVELDWGIMSSMRSGMFDPAVLPTLRLVLESRDQEDLQIAHRIDQSLSYGVAVIETSPENLDSMYMVQSVSLSNLIELVCTAPLFDEDYDVIDERMDHWLSIDPAYAAAHNFIARSGTTRQRQVFDDDEIQQLIDALVPLVRSGADLSTETISEVEPIKRFLAEGDEHQRAMLEQGILDWLNQLDRARDQRDVLRRALTIVTAVERYTLANEEMPTTIGQLVPDYLEPEQTELVAGLPISYEINSDGRCVIEIGMPEAEPVTHFRYLWYSDPESYRLNVEWDTDKGF